MERICAIINNTRLAESREIYSMEIEFPAAKFARPGQFVMVKCGKGDTLRRPISICDAHDGILRLCYEVRGSGTERLARMEPGKTVSLLGPLGRGFDAADKTKRVLLAGGGIGAYPLLLAARFFDGNAHAALGFRSVDFVTHEEDFRKFCPVVRVATDDGSYGFKGYANALVREMLAGDGYDILFVCGPKIMMHGVAEAARDAGVRCQVSMEERMGCGVGACLACVCNTRGDDGETHKSRVCSDGPVFEAQAVFPEIYV